VAGSIKLEIAGAVSGGAPGEFILPFVLGGCQDSGYAFFSSWIVDRLGGVCGFSSH
jgi:hypothetical protein